MPDIQSQIKNELRQIEQAEQVQVLYACESGSRAWGFPSEDSDYDVRFVYVRPRDWYLSIDIVTRRDVIERPISDELDINGWDLRKALQLLRKSNPPLLEWLNSPIVYHDRRKTAARLRTLIERAYSPPACMFHYLHMARGNFRDYLRHDTIWLKKYFYVLRPLLAVQWIEQGRGIVPVAFGTLLDTLVTDSTLRHEIDLLLARKQAGDELAAGPRNPVISQYIEGELARQEHVRVPPVDTKPSYNDLNALFRTMVEEGEGAAAEC